jgi:DNA-directed RNA polymerase specialized sigma24 family protein
MSDSLDPPIEELTEKLIVQARAIAWKHWHAAPYVLEFDELLSLAYKGLSEAAARWPVYCVVPSTPVLTADLRWVPAGDLTAGHRLVGFDEYPAKRDSGWAMPRAYRTAEVLSVRELRLSCVRVTLEDGRQVTCSTNHRWLTYRQYGYYRAKREQKVSSSNSWVASADLLPGDRISSPLRPWAEETSFEMGWLSGIYDGEGTVGHNNVSVSQNPGLVLDRIKQLLSSMDIPFGERERAEDRCTVLSVSVRRYALELLGRLRPVRLLPKAAGSLWEDRGMWNRKELCAARIVEIEPVGLQIVTALRTDTGTFLANGLASHNCQEHNFDPARTRFYAVYCQRRMTGSILDYMRSQDWVSRTVRNNARSLRDAGQDQGQSESAMASATGLTRAEVSQTIAAMARRPVGFDPAEHDVTDSADTESHVVVSDLLNAAVSALEELPVTEQFAAVLTFYCGLTPKDAAKVLGMGVAEVTALQQQAAVAVHRVLAEAAGEIGGAQ